MDGIDISSLAIEMAKEIAAQRRLEINYAVADICELASVDHLYDLIVDSFCLQCIVTDSDRASVFSNVRLRLKPEGYYMIGTAIFAEERSYGGQAFDKKTGVAYLKTENNQSDPENAVEFPDGWHLPSRRHLKPEVLIDELKEAGFKTLWHHAEGRSMGLLCQRAETITQ